MKRTLLVALVMLLAVGWSYGQVVNAFDAEPDSTYWAVYMNDNASADSAFINLSIVPSPVYEGAGAMQLVYSAHDMESWGGFTKIEHWNPDSNACYDFSGFDSISFWYYNAVPQSLPGRVHLRFNLHDVSNSVNGAKTYNVLECEYYYSFHYILDNTPGWHEIKMPLVSNDSWDGNGFNLTGWSGITGNAVLDKDKIKGFSVEFSISGLSQKGTRSHGTVILDHLTLKGVRKVDLVFFNGMAIPGNVGLYGGWGGGGYEIAEGLGATAGTNAILWHTPPNTWAVWDGLVWTFADFKNMAPAWKTDSLGFKIKADAGLGPLKIVIGDDNNDGDGPDLEYESFYNLTEAEVGYDGSWKNVKIALDDFDRNGGGWNGSAMQYDQLMDSTRVKTLKILIASTDGVGKNVYLDDIWTGNPAFDWTPPEIVQNVDAVPSADHYNLVIWQDVPGENGESYNVYASRTPITDITAPEVELVASKVMEGTQNAIHYIYYPLENHNMTYYYAVNCTDASGNAGPAGVSAAIVNVAKGIPTIALGAPTGFAVDGDFTEWFNSGIKPWVLTPENDFVPVGAITDSSDLKATVWLAIDDDYLYVAADVVDNVYHFGEGNWWDQDAFEFFIGLYNSKGSKHTGNRRGAEPDYKLQFHKNGVVNEYIGNTIWTVEDADFHLEDFSGVDYIIEARVPLDSIAGPEDVRFHPARGMRIPLELYFHDNDGSGWDGNLAWSPFNTDHAWQTPTEWSYTWIGDTTDVVSVVNYTDNRLPKSYRLEQNYPNPFNPTTSIAYALPHPGMVTLTVFNMLGQKVAELVNQYQTAGNYNVNWDAAGVPSGIYFYQLTSGVYTQTKKMLLVK